MSEQARTAGRIAARTKGAARIPVGILLFAGAAHWLRLAELIDEVGWRHVVVIAFLAGVGFTVSLFITELASSSEEPLCHARVTSVRQPAASDTSEAAKMIL